MQSAIVAQPTGFAGFIPNTGETGQVKIGGSVIVRHTGDSVEIIDRKSRADHHCDPGPDPELSSGVRARRSNGGAGRPDSSGVRRGGRY